VQQAKIVVRGTDSADSDRLTTDLIQTLRRGDGVLPLERRKSDDQTLDLGATVAVLVGSPAAATVAYGIAAWIARHRGVEVEVRMADRQMRLKNVDIDTAERRIAEFFSS
jgi:hypothetical protein